MKQRLVLVMFLIVLASAMAPMSYAMPSLDKHLLLYQKDSATWLPVPWGAWAYMRYTSASDRFWFQVNGHDFPQALKGTTYQLIYYPDPWPGNGLICLGNGKVNSRGDLSFSSFATIRDIPVSTDQNYAQGAKIWLVTNADVNCTSRQMIAWNPSQYLFEAWFIRFHSTHNWVNKLVKVDIGNQTSEKQTVVGYQGVSISSWGPVEPTTHGGSWGTITLGTCRVTYAPGTGANDRDKAGYVRVCGVGSFARDGVLTIRVLNGQGVDSFKVYVNNVLIDTYVPAQHQGEVWENHTYPLQSMPTGCITIKIQATGPSWSGINTYGQLAVDWVQLTWTQ